MHFSKTIETITDIDASVERVWAIITEFKSYGDWNSFLAIDGDMTEGEVIASTISVKTNALTRNPSRTSMKSKVLAARPNQELRWKGTTFLLRGLYDTEHFLVIEKVDRRKCRLKHGQTFTGCFVCFHSFASNPKPGILEFNQALKERSETGNLGNISSVKLHTAVSKLKKTKSKL